MSGGGLWTGPQLLLAGSLLCLAFAVILGISELRQRRSHCGCCGHRRVGDHAGRVCPCADRDAWDGAR